MSIKPQLMILLGAIVVGIIGIAFAFLLSRPPSDKGTIFGKIEKPDVDSIIRLQSKVLSVDFKNDDKIPKTGQVYKFNESEISNKKAIEIAARLGFVSRVRGFQTLTWESKKSTLTIDLAKRTLEIKFLKVKPLKGEFSADKLAEAATKFMDKIGLSTQGLTADTSNTRIIEAGAEEVTVTKPTNPFFIEMSFNRKLDNYNVFYPNPAEPAVALTLNNKGQVAWIYYRFADINKTTVGSYPLVDIKKIELKSLVSSGKLVFPQPGRGLFEPELIKTITVEDFSLVYLDDQVGEYIQLVYLLRGYATLGTESFSVVIYYPAIEEKWLK